MRKLGTRSQKWLKALHIFFAALWAGGAFAMVTRQFGIHADHGMELYGILSMLKYIDDCVIIPGAIGSLLTGLTYSIWTNWGWIKHRWIAVKWLINLFGVLFGTFFLGPWLNGLPPIALEKGLLALSDPAYLHNRRMLYIFGTFQCLTIIFALVLSALKPWKARAGK